ncbi:MAG: glycosyltransferase family 9 protein [Acidobacteria bacterium]|nr:glycosyltransferase family 9 protein [Acidobacteriota bacterium]
MGTQPIPNKILIVRLGAIGDVVHTLPALAALRTALPEAYLAWAVERGGSAKLLNGNPYLDELIELDLRGWRKNWKAAETRTAMRAGFSALRNAKFDLALDFQGLLKSAAVSWLARVPRRVGFDKESLREPASRWLTTEHVWADDQDHVIKKNLRLVASLGCDVPPQFEFPINLDASDEQFAQEQWERNQGALAILNPGGGWPTKLWHTSEFAQIADRLWEAYGIRSAITYGPGELTLAQMVVAQSKTGAAFPLASTLKQFWALARRAKLFLGGDTGPMHLAAAARTPIVALFGPTSARRNGPFSPNDLVVERFDLDCRTDCYRRYCSHTSCMKLPVEQVWQAVVKRLQVADSGQRGFPVHQTKL